MGFEGAQVDLDHLVEVLRRIGVDLGIPGEVLGDAIRELGHFGPAGAHEEAAHAVVVAEGAGGGPDLGAHVADGALAGAAQALGAGAEILHDGPGAPLHGEDAGHLQDHVLGAGPAAHLPGELHADELGELELPGQPAHHVAGVGATHPDGHHTQASGVHGVAVGTDHHGAGEGVLLQHHLVDDAGAGLPEADAVLVAHALQEAEDLVALVQGLLQVLGGTHAGLDQVIAVHGAGHGHLFAAGGHELEQGHLGGGVLHGHPVGGELHVVLAAPEGGLRLAVPEVGVQDLLRQGQGPADHLAGGLHACGEAVVHRLDHVEVEDLGHGHGLVSGPQR